MKVIQIIYSDIDELKVYLVPEQSSQAQRLKEYNGYFIGTDNGELDNETLNDDEFLEIFEDLEEPVIQTEVNSGWETFSEEPVELVAIYMMGQMQS